jgi:glycogen debranching enzyme
MSKELFSGWGIMVMATGEGGYNPDSYRNGSIRL